MPNWVQNKIVFRGYDSYVKAREFMTKHKFDGGLDIANEFNFEAIVPMPPHIYRGVLTPEAEELFGAENCWYRWRIKNWESKWNSSDVVWSPNENTVYFQTPWSPVPKLMALFAAMGDLEFEYFAADEDIGSNVMYMRFENLSLSGNTLVEYRDFESDMPAAVLLAKDLWDIPLDEEETE